MMTESRESRAAKIQDSIREILRPDWNPIGIPDLPADEYDADIAPVHRVLTGNRSESELIACLARIERDEFGTTCSSPEPLRQVARKRLDLDVRL